jgi:hypothetical protein
MKKIKQIVEQIQSASTVKSDLHLLLWQLICYSPQWPLRLQQQQLLDSSEKFSFKIFDQHFSNSELKVNGFKWGTGKRRILLTHGWGSKAGDFMEMITAINQIDDVTVITFDAPGNGSSEGSLSNLILYSTSVEEIVRMFGQPDVVIGHSLGAMANVRAFKENPPAVMISLAPLIKLKENFMATMSMVKIPVEDQEKFMATFESRFGVKAADFDLNKMYEFDENVDHWLAYDEKDHVAPYPYLKSFLDKHPSIITGKFENVGHEKIIKDPAVIQEITKKIDALAI